MFVAASKAAEEHGKVDQEKSEKERELRHVKKRLIHPRAETFLFVGMSRTSCPLIWDRMRNFFLFRVTATNTRRESEFSEKRFDLVLNLFSDTLTNCVLLTRSRRDRSTVDQKRVWGNFVSLLSDRAFIRFCDTKIVGKVEWRVEQI